MKKSNVSKFIKNVQKLLYRRSPEILTGIGIAGMISTTILAVKATPTALILIERAELAKNDDADVDECILTLTTIEVIKASWKCYIPATVTCTVSIVCLVGASAVNARRNTALATVYRLSQTALSEYQEKVIETIGERKEQGIRDEIAKDKINNHPASNIIITEKGNILCYDPVIDRYFKSDIEKIRKTVNELNRKMTNEMYISLNDFYYELGLKNVKMGRDMGWNIDDGLIEVNFSAQISEDDTPCIVMDYQVGPRCDYINH